VVEGTDYYAVLGVLPTAEPDVLTAAYRALVKKYHPDVYTGGRDDAERITKNINEAYAVLSDAAKRADYDSITIVPRMPGRRAGVHRRATKSWRVDSIRTAILIGSLIILGGLGFTVWKETRQTAPVQISDENSLTAIPAAFVGDWVRDAHDCRSRAGTSRLSISAMAIVYQGFAPIEVRSVQRVNDNELAVSVLPEPGPQKESTTARWRMSSDRSGLMIDWDDAAAEFLHRCAK
jgi:curved DNA-binding protein CbpA